MSIDQLSSIKVKPVQGRDCQAPEQRHQARGKFIADAESYGAEKLWVLLKGIPIELDGDDEDGDDEDAE